LIRLFGLKDAERYDWTLKEGRYTIGRSPECNLVIDDYTISRYHALIEIVDQRKINLTDLGSLNGTRVMDQIITGTTRLEPNDMVSFGEVEFQVATVGKEKTSVGSVSVSEIDHDLENATLLPIKDALRLDSAGIAYNPKVFGVLSELGKVRILPDPGAEVFGKALELLQEIIPAERVAILLTGQGEQEFHLAASRLSRGESSGSFTISRTIVRELLTQRNAILISDPQFDPRFSDVTSIVGSGIRSAMAVPLFDEDKILGILYADTTNPFHHYTEDFLRITAIFGSVLAAKISNHNLLKDRQAKERLEAELSVASQIQCGLLPRKLSKDIEGYRYNAFQTQCRMVGGDLYDVAELASGRILFLVADVSGKGMGAALLMSNVLAAFRILYRAEDFSLLDVTRRVSRQLLQFSRAQDFATMFICELCTKTHRLRYVNAGHNPPMMVRGDGRVDYLESSGIPIGAFDICDWKEETLEFAAGDFLFAFTDGIPEATSADDQLYGQERLKELVLSCRGQCPEELTQSIMLELRQFTGRAPQSDDITMMTLRRKR
jgi:serine phosphatase RsbU (regulator of sigma subunit)/pSer/pThr/pTyr-binding forkhead associated (FHA) protein